MLNHASVIVYINSDYTFSIEHCVSFVPLKMIKIPRIEKVQKSFISQNLLKFLKKSEKHKFKTSYCRFKNILVHLTFSAQGVIVFTFQVSGGVEAVTCEAIQDIHTRGILSQTCCIPILYIHAFIQIQKRVEQFDQHALTIRLYRRLN